MCLVEVFVNGIDRKVTQVGMSRGREGWLAPAL